jgi:hypothetical protein
MTEAQVGWHPDPRDPAVMWFWSGSEWTASRVWDGTNWVDRPDPGIRPLGADTQGQAVIPTAPISAPSPAVAAVQMTGARLSTTGWLLCGGVAAVVIAALLPWSQASELGVTVTTKPSGGGPIFLIVLAGLALLIGWPGLGQKMQKRRALGLILMVAVISIFAITNWASLGNLQTSHPDQKITAGSGLVLYTVGVVVLWVSAVRSWRSRVRLTSNP